MASSNAATNIKPEAGGPFTTITINDTNAGSASGSGHQATTSPLANPQPTDPRLDQINNIDTIPDHLPLVDPTKGRNALPDGQWNIHVLDNLTAAAEQCIVLATQHRQTAAAISTMFFLLSIVEILSSAISTSVSFAQWPRTAAGEVGIGGMPSGRDGVRGRDLFLAWAG
jgi:hypothetical protein